MGSLVPNKTYTMNGVTVNEYLLTNHNPNRIDMPTSKIYKPIGITIHNTDWINVSAETTPAEQYTRATVNGNMGDVRVHFYVDDKCAWQNLPLDRAGWHAADGDGDGNRRTIAIECIMSGGNDSRYIKSEDNCAKLTAALLKKFGLPVSVVYAHKHWYSPKYCPAYILPHWERFKATVNKYYSALSEKPVLDTDGYRSGSATIGSFALKELLLAAKRAGIHSFGMDESKCFGKGTLNAVNFLLNKWGYKQNGIAGENFIKRLSAEIGRAVK